MRRKTTPLATKVAVFYRRQVELLGCAIPRAFSVGRTPQNMQQSRIKSTFSGRSSLKMDICQNQSLCLGESLHTQCFISG